MLVLAALLAWGVTLYAGYHYGKVGAERKLTRAQQTVVELKKEAAGLHRRYADIEASLERAERQLQIDKVAYSQLGTDLRAAGAELASLRNELDFYRSIIAPEDGQGGVRFQEFRVAATGIPGLFAYRLVVIQALQHSRDVDGVLTLEVRGKRGDKPESISVPTAGAEDIAVRFRYFQSLEGQFALPENLVPSEVKVMLKHGRDKSSALERWYRWSDIFG